MIQKHCLSGGGVGENMMNLHFIHLPLSYQLIYLSICEDITTLLEGIRVLEGECTPHLATCACTKTMVETSVSDPDPDPNPPGSIIFLPKNPDGYFK